MELVDGWDTGCLVGIETWSHSLRVTAVMPGGLGLLRLGLHCGREFETQYVEWYMTGQVIHLWCGVHKNE